MSILRVEGCVENPQSFTYEQLAALPAEFQVRDVSRLDPKRQGMAITLQGLCQLVRPTSDSQYLGLHATTDDFHASLPLAPILAKSVLIYDLHGEPLPVKAGGPFRFFIPDHHACHTHEIDECANVKFVDRLEFTRVAGFDNRPHDEIQHADLHAKEKL
jgi:DMSO/TMAO reductase YedYZ molybdopterin-dependent catalytic subunit